MHKDTADKIDAMLAHHAEHGVGKIVQMYVPACYRPGCTAAAGDMGRDLYCSETCYDLDSMPEIRWAKPNRG